MLRLQLRPTVLDKRFCPFKHLLPFKDATRGRPNYLCFLSAAQIAALSGALHAPRQIVRSTPSSKPHDAQRYTLANQRQDGLHSLISGFSTDCFGRRYAYSQSFCAPRANAATTRQIAINNVRAAEVSAYPSSRIL
jgi:hypothetical protein